MALGGDDPGRITIKTSQCDGLRRERAWEDDRIATPRRRTRAVSFRMSRIAAVSRPASCVDRYWRIQFRPHGLRVGLPEELTGELLGGEPVRADRKVTGDGDALHPAVEVS